MTVMEDLHQAWASNGCANFRIMNFYEQCIMEDRILEAQSSEAKDDEAWPLSLLLVVHARLGMNNISQVYLDQIKILM